MNKSILISWHPPDTYPGHIEMYHVYVDGFLRTTVKATDKTKALVEGVDNARVSILCDIGLRLFVSTKIKNVGDLIQKFAILLSINLYSDY